MKKFKVQCIHRTSGDPYVIVVQATSAESAKLIAAQSHIAGQATAYDSTTRSVDSNTRLLELVLGELQTMNSNLMTPASLRISIRQGVFYALLTWSLVVVVFVILLLILLMLSYPAFMLLRILLF